MRSVDVPQADRLEGIREVVDAVGRGQTRFDTLGTATGLAARHVHYYTQAARILGFVRVSRAESVVTEAGSALSATERGSLAEAELLKDAIQRSRALSRLIGDLFAEGVDRERLASRLESSTGLSRSTALRRAVTLMRWRNVLLDRLGGDAPRRQTKMKVRDVLERLDRKEPINLLLDKRRLRRGGKISDKLERLARSYRGDMRELLQDLRVVDLRAVARELELGITSFEGDELRRRLIRELVDGDRRGTHDDDGDAEGEHPNSRSDDPFPDVGERWARPLKIRHVMEKLSRSLRACVPSRSLPSDDGIKANERDLVGRITILLVGDRNGGDVGFVECAHVDGNGISVTGRRGIVLEQSVHASYDALLHLAPQIGLSSDRLRAKRMSVHLVNMAEPKEGPSAGLAFALAMFSAATGRPIQRGLAVTGELSVQGRVGPIGGVLEKLDAAARHERKLALIPSANAAELAQAPALAQRLRVEPVADLIQAMALVFSTRAVGT